MNFKHKELPVQRQLLNNTLQQHYFILLTQRHSESQLSIIIYLHWCKPVISIQRMRWTRSIQPPQTPQKLSGKRDLFLLEGNRLAAPPAPLPGVPSTAWLRNGMGRWKIAGMQPPQLLAILCPASNGTLGSAEHGMWMLRYQQHFVWASSAIPATVQPSSNRISTILPAHQCPTRQLADLGLDYLTAYAMAQNRVFESGVILPQLI